MRLNQCPECGERPCSVRNTLVCYNHPAPLYFTWEGIPLPAMPEAPVFDPTRRPGDSDVMYFYAASATEQRAAIAMDDMMREHCE